MVGLAAHLAEVDRTVFSADILFALIVSWLGLRRDRLACQAETNIMLVFTFTILLSHKTKVSNELQEGMVTFSEKYDTILDPFVVCAVP